MLPPDQRRHALFSETRMSGAKQPAFCGAGMHRSAAEGRFGEAEPAGRSSVCARALLIGVDKTCDRQYCPEVNAGFLPKKE